MIGADGERWDGKLALREEGPRAKPGHDAAPCDVGRRGLSAPDGARA
jgi:hypothetical protein